MFGGHLENVVSPNEGEHIEEGTTNITIEIKSKPPHYKRVRNYIER